MGNQAQNRRTQLQQERLGSVVTGVRQHIGRGFTALHFSAAMFEGRMDPLLMVDHFVMTEPTFAPHMHAGISAVTAMFEDAKGRFLNRDTLGHNIALRAGDLYWLTAAGGAAHEEKPEPGARTHALQIFVDLPAHLKKAPARALHVRAEEVPVLEGEHYRVRLVLGASGGLTGATGTPSAITLLDGTLEPGGKFVHALVEGQQAWVYAVSGQLALHVHGEVRVLEEGQATTVTAGPAADVMLESRAASHFTLLAGAPVLSSSVKPGSPAITDGSQLHQTPD